MKDIKPTTISGIKRLAKEISKREGLSHSSGLDRASTAAGFSNYQHALRSFNEPPARPNFGEFLLSFPGFGPSINEGAEIFEVTDENGDIYEAVKLGNGPWEISYPEDAD